MPTIRKLQEEEVRKAGSGGDSARAQVAREYDTYLAEFDLNEYGEAVTGEDESKLTVKNRLKAAAKRRGWNLQFLRTPGPVIRFQVVEEEQATNGADETAEAGAEEGSLEQTTKRRGRPKKQPTL